MREKHAVRGEIMVQVAIALDLSTAPGGVTGIGEPIGRIVRRIKEYLGDPLITRSRVREILDGWVRAGWVTLTHKYVALTARGAMQINSIANAAV
jgi:hypothetical protein